MQAIVIWLRFGSLNDDSNPCLTTTEVFKRTGVKMCSQHKIIDRWRRRGFVIMMTKGKGRKPMMSQEQMEWLTSKEVLMGMSHLDLRRRAEEIRLKF